jgi:hypothetical protein
MSKHKKTGYPVHVWRAKFAEAAKYCARNKSPGERIQDCIKRYLGGGKIGIRA